VSDVSLQQVMGKTPLWTNLARRIKSTICILEYVSEAELTPETVRVLKVFANLASPGCGGGGGVYHITCLARKIFDKKRWIPHKPGKQLYRTEAFKSSAKTKYLASFCTIPKQKKA